MQLEYVVGSIIIVSIGLIVHFWTGKYYSTVKFQTFLRFITTLTSILFSSAIVLQVINYANQKANEEVQNYGQLSKTYLDDTINFFIKHPEMNYYYEDLFDIKPIDENTKRNIILEKQISMLIFSRLAKFAAYLQAEDDEAARNKVGKWMNHITETFMKSDTLRHYWITEYKPKLSGPATINYMKEHFNL